MGAMMRNLAVFLLGIDMSEAHLTGISTYLPGFFISGSPVLNGKEFYHKGHKVHKGGKSLDFVGFPFVTVVSFVFEKWHPVKNGRALFQRLGAEAILPYEQN
jgi:hypothetical protein